VTVAVHLNVNPTLIVIRPLTCRGAESSTVAITSTIPVAITITPTSTIGARLVMNGQRSMSTQRLRPASLPSTATT